LTRLNLQSSYCITINNVEFFNGVAAQLNLDTPGRERLRRLIDTREAAELERFLKDPALAELTRLTGKQDVIQAARRLIDNERSAAALQSLDDLWTEIESLGLQDSFEIDLGDVPSLDYYTGLSLKIFVHAAGYSTGRGRRYA